jgi:lysophospholipase L1-like esterase
VQNRRFLIAASSLIAVAGLLGVWSLAQRGTPAPYLSRLHDAVSRLFGEKALAVDEQNDASGRTAVACPPANDRTMVALVLGQSQAANLVKERFVGDTGVVNYFRGRCYRAADPLLGNDYGGGNVWTLVGNELVRQQLFDAVVLVTAAVSGSYIGQWAPGGRLHARLMDAVGSIGPGLAFTHVFMAQGESDLMAGTPAEEYFARYARVIAALRRSGIRAPIFVAIESGYCDGVATPPGPDNPIVRSQKRLIAEGEGLYSGPDMDAELNSASDRYDGCHMSGTGARKLSRLWTKAITVPAPGRPH